MRDRKNKFDRSDCLERGEQSEFIFKTIAIRNNWEIFKSTETENIDQHWDYLIVKGKEKYRVEVKSAKKISRSDNSIQDAWTWVELHGVRENDGGWLFSGKADLIAFEKRDSFIIVKRTDLLKKIALIIDFGSVVSDSAKAQYKVYHRQDRFDKISLIETKRLDSIRWDEWKK